MVGYQGPRGMNFLLENHSWGPFNFDSLDESKENMKPSNQKNEEVIVNMKRNREITTENDENNIITSGEGTNGKNMKSDHEMHLSIERDRRKKMKDMYDGLRALLPPLPSKADKSTIVGEAVNYIKILQETREKLEKRKQERSQNVLKEIMGTSNAVLGPGPKPIGFDTTWAASNMVLNIFGDEVQFSIRAAHKPGLVTTIASVLETHKIEAISGSISCNDGKTCMIQLHGKQASDANSAEETYNQMAEEIMRWIS